MQEMLPVILSSIISFLNTMDSSEYLISVMDILLFFAENQQNLFAARFNVKRKNYFINVGVLTAMKLGNH